jgi:hypothetical protein
MESVDQDFANPFNGSVILFTSEVSAGGPAFHFVLTAHDDVDDTASIIQHGVMALGLRVPRP